MNKLRTLGVIASQNSGGSLDADYLLYAAAMSTAPSGSWANACSQMFVNIKSALSISNISDAFDVLYVFAAETEQAALLNAANPGSNTATNVNTATFTSNQGLTGNGSTSYLNTNYNPSTQGVVYTLNNASAGVYIRTNTNNGVEIGGNNGSGRLFLLARNAGFYQGYVNETSGITFGLSVATSDSRGFSVINRSANNSIQGYKNGSPIGSNATTSTVIPTLNIYILANNNSGSPISQSDKQVALAYFGRSMSATEHANLYTAIQTFMTAIGAQV